MKESDGLLTKWAQLRSEPTNYSTDLIVPTIPLPVESGGQALRLSTGDGNEPRLLIPLSRDSRQEFASWQGPALDIKTIPLDVSNTSTRFIDIKCIDERLHSVFADFVSEVVRRIDNGLPPQESISRALHDFISLFRKQGSKTISRELALGLTGELIVLNEIMNTDVQGWVTWKGPEGGVHDFNNGFNGIEVKSGRRQQERTVQINAIDQLEPPIDGILYLAHLVLEETIDGPVVPLEIASNLVELAPDPNGLTAKLKSAGLDICGDTSAWENLRFSLLGFEFYEVAAGFPKLTRENLVDPELPPGISHLSYKLHLSHARNFRLSSSKKELLLKEFASHV